MKYYTVTIEVAGIPFTSEYSDLSKAREAMLAFMLNDMPFYFSYYEQL